MDEQSISNAHFYFYDAEGAYRAQGEATGVSGSAGTSDNIEFKSNTVVAVWGIEDTSVPKYMVTVLNQPKDFVYGRTLEDMGKALAGGNCGWQDESGNLVMSTSSYVGYNETRPASFVTEISEDDFRSEPVNIATDYEDDNGVVQVYVERLAAKVQVDVNLQNDGVVESETNGYLIPAAPLGLDSENIIAKEGELTDSPLYIALNGWNLTGTARNSNIVKDITGFDVNSGIDGWTGWNAPGDHRSYWGKSYNYGKTDSPYPANAVRDATVSYQANTDADESGAVESLWLNSYLRYSSLTDALPFGDDGCAYCSENTNSTDVLEKKTSSAITNVVLKGQIGSYDVDGDEFTPTGLVMFNGKYYTVDAFKDHIAESFMDGETEEYAKYVFGDDFWDYIVRNVSGMNMGELDTHLWLRKKDDLSAAYEAFDGRFVKLMDRGDGNVSVRFNAPKAVCYTSTSMPENEAYNPNEEYQETYKLEGKPISPAEASLDDYDMYCRWNAKTEDQVKVIVLGLEVLKGFGMNLDFYESYNSLCIYLLLNDDEYMINQNAGDGYCNYRNAVLDMMEKGVWAMNELFADEEQSPMWPEYYQDGLMYYNAPIEHLNNEQGAILEAQYGVVRNHWYKVTVEDVSQLGTPIANEESVIVPQDKDLQYLGASVNVLSWKVVDQTMSFTNP